MDLFLAAGLDVPNARRGAQPRRAAGPRTLRVPLFNHRVIEEARARAAFSPTPDEVEAAREYARRAKSASFARQRETSVRPIFFGQVLGRVLGYREFDPDQPYSVSHEHPIRGGSADVALGRFRGTDRAGEIVAPCEVKGPGTDLDAIPPGRARSPVQQAWDYAIDAPGTRWVIVTNCVELRLYAFGRGRDAYHVFDLSKLDDPEEHARLWLLLSSDRLLGEATDALLRQTDSAAKEITDKLYGDYSDLRARLISFLTGSAEGPKLAPLEALEPAQKILDRVLFIAFAQRTGLISQPVLEQAEKTQAFIPVSKWTNFKGLFHFCNVGNFDRDIEAFNGGLFAADPILDRIEVPDDLVTDLAKLGEWDYRSDVPVTILGHIFEQSITDLERLRAEGRGEAPPKVSKRKREGVVYTPDLVTRFLVERTLGLTLSERFSALLREHAGIDVLPKNGGVIPWRKGEGSEKAFWRGYLATLRDTTVVDPACGSGAFLVAAFDLLAAEYRRVTERLAALGEPVDFDPLDWIVTRNLYGVDLNAESVEITRLSLWLKTARRKHRLQNLEATIKPGDSLIDDSKYTREPFEWQAAFPDVFAQGGFDVVIGNPPYVRMEILKPVKTYLEEHYRVATDRADLYAYFFEKGVALLKPGGRLGYVSSSTFFRTGSGDKLRALLSQETAVEAVIDFGDEQIFEGVTTYPAILTLRKLAPGADAAGDLRFLKIEGTVPRELSGAFDAGALPMPRARLTGASWQFEEDALARLRAKIVAGKKTLGEVYGPPWRGIVTGLNGAFVIDRATRDRLVAADPKSEELLKPFLRGEDIKRWRVEPRGLFLINTPKGKVDIDAYPAIRDWLLPFKPRLEKRATQQKWFELQQAQLAYQPHLKTAKITWPHFQSERASFALDQIGYYLNNKCFFISAEETWLTAVLNSACLWFQLSSLARIKRGGYIEAEAQYVEQLALPEPGERDGTRLETIGQDCTRAARERFETQAAVRRRILDLAPGGDGRLSRKLESWWELDFPGFLAEVKRVLKTDVPLRQRGEWESFLAENRAAVQRLTAEIDAAEREIDAIVYGLFDLTPEEIALLESSLEAPVSS